MAKLVDPTSREIRELSDDLVSRVVRTIGFRQAEWQLERGADGYKNLSDCPPENVRGQQLWLMSYVAQGILVEHNKIMKAGGA